MLRCYVTDRKQGDVLVHAARAVAQGVDIIQVREKDLEAGALFQLVCRIRDLAAGTSTKILVNDRLDIALAADIDGVHLPENGLPVARVRPYVRVLGASVHSVEAARRAESEKVDFVFFGPVFETPGKQAVGIRALQEVVQAVHIPVLAIGGITASNTSLVLDAGAAGIAAIRLFQME
jgi:thiamine-phosphate pyrophosphorylase